MTVAEFAMHAKFAYHRGSFLDEFISDVAYCFIQGNKTITTTVNKISFCKFTLTVCIGKNPTLKVLAHNICFNKRQYPPPLPSSKGHTGIIK